MPILTYFKTKVCFTLAAGFRNLYTGPTVGKIRNAQSKLFLEFPNATAPLCPFLICANLIYSKSTATYP